jgi:hypothetical protein
MLDNQLEIMRKPEIRGFAPPAPACHCKFACRLSKARRPGARAGRPYWDEGREVARILVKPVVGCVMVRSVVLDSWQERRWSWPRILGQGNILHVSEKGRYI